MRRYLVERGAHFSTIQQAGRGTECHLIPGTVLVREWDEREYRVTVTADGLYELNGQRFKSLSAAARHITGTQWSEPKFFGLKAGKGGKR